VSRVDNHVANRPGGVIKVEVLNMPDFPIQRGELLTVKVFYILERDREVF